MYCNYANTQQNLELKDETSASALGANPLPDENTIPDAGVTTAAKKKKKKKKKKKAAVGGDGDDGVNPVANDDLKGRDPM